MIRAVFDTNVLVSALIQPSSPPGLLLARLVEGESFELMMSSVILDELERAVRYPAVRKRIRATDEDLELVLTMLDTLSSPVQITATISGVSRDPDDDEVIATAVEGLADYIVTGDNDLLALGEYGRIRIVTPRTFLEVVGR